MLVFDYRLIVLFIGFIFLFENDQIKDIKEEIQINMNAWTNPL